MEILPPPNTDDMLHHIWFVSLHIENRIAATPTPQDYNLIPVVKVQGSLHFFIDFCEIQNLHVAIELLDDTQPLE